MDCYCAIVLQMMYLGMRAGAPATFEVRVERWENSSWGFHDVRRQSMRIKVKRSGNGSLTADVDVEERRNWLLLDSTDRVQLNYHRSDDTMLISGERGPAPPFRCRCSGEWFSRSDTCHDITKGMGAGQKGRVAGHAVLWYQVDDEDGGGNHSLAVAPQFGCEVMDEVKVRWNALRVPVSYWRRWITRYEAGEPR